jgi:hypothetical protein
VQESVYHVVLVNSPLNLVVCHALLVLLVRMLPPSPLVSALHAHPALCRTKTVKHHVCHADLVNSLPVTVQHSVHSVQLEQLITPHHHKEQQHVIDAHQEHSKQQTDNSHAHHAQSDTSHQPMQQSYAHRVPLVNTPM